MAGRKHHLQQFGYMNNDWNKIEDPFERDLAFKTLQTSAYCKVCGKEVLDSEYDEMNMKVNWEWEQKNLVHYRCAMKSKAEAEDKARLETAKEELERAERERDFNWDKYMRDMLDKRE